MSLEGSCEPCDDLQSAMWFVGEYEDILLASSSPWYCEAYSQVEAEVGQAMTTHYEVVSAAEDAHNGPAACAASLEYYQLRAAIEAQWFTPGGCDLTLIPHEVEPGEYVEYGNGPGEFRGWVTYYASTCFDLHLDLIDGCSEIDNWASWVALDEELYDLTCHGTSQAWSLEDGMMTLAEGDDILATGSGLELSCGDYGSGVLDFEIEAVFCGEL